VAIWPLLAIAAVIVAVHPSFRPEQHGTVTATAVGTPNDARPPSENVHVKPARQSCVYRVIREANAGRVGPGFSIACLLAARRVARSDPDLIYTRVDEMLTDALRRAGHP
jgi:hypothetical protein